MSHQNELDPWRQGIRDIDAKILELLAERMQLAQKIGSYKQKHNLPVKDFRVEKQIIEKSRDQAAQLGLYPSLAEDLMTTIIKYSVLRQDELKRKSVTMPAGLGQEAVIVGGGGQMGQWFAQFYESMGFSVSVYDPASTTEHNYPVVADLDANINQYDLIVLATPMLSTDAILKQLISLKPRGLIIEICSLKSPVIDSLLEAAAQGIRVASIHPMFGPDAEMLADKNILFCTANGLVSEEVMQLHFQQTSAHLIALDLQEHDRLMSYVLGSSHLINLLYASILSDSGESLQKLKSMGGTTFLQQAQVTSKVVEENQDLYFDIQALNDETPMLLQEFQTLLDAWRKAIEEKDRKAFRRLMGRAQVYFGD
ncbi:bifunctional chorismate mutase/prephenate dehydrogenase [Oligoflexus tunisiensis]|uniref:bifunctional chorismate mutase/prephenate dehydrogenase n=1 Tax=Oligoflexus tunisiensis TaxID=708132 RepID=UPI00159EFF1A|nr:bifunctional chorismate mutase/prephenate dehydrogenase [Oligoflexus tunisiensis]